MHSLLDLDNKEITNDHRVFADNQRVYFTRTTAAVNLCFKTVYGTSCFEAHTTCGVEDSPREVSNYQLSLQTCAA
jgi:hypothetical protein